MAAEVQESMMADDPLRTILESLKQAAGVLAMADKMEVRP